MQWSLTQHPSRQSSQATWRDRTTQCDRCPHGTAHSPWRACGRPYVTLRTWGLGHEHRRLPKLYELPGFAPTCFCSDFCKTTLVTEICVWQREQRKVEVFSYFATNQADKNPQRMSRWNFQGRKTLSLGKPGERNGHREVLGDLVLKERSLEVLLQAQC